MKTPVLCGHCGRGFQETGTACDACKAPVHIECFHNKKGCPNKASVAPTPGPLPFPIPERRREGADSDVPKAAGQAGEALMAAPELALIGTIIIYPNGHKLIVAGITENEGLLVLPYDDRGLLKRWWHAFLEWKNRPRLPQHQTWPGKDKVEI